ncbi:fibrillarin-like rRNA methylase [Cenarchaeum symbiosum A]|uniref:Fibrillarin-like rRNA/tRNA 2'-O-methyltransferase n=1 Tax=Cenarchaeum symbiosum (strain A) TaxID=414004 RepID=A0RV24_CENSY|nr:fibrillarin-like rRNA methylase [Cenarchaeum symbiosum A]
MDPGCSVYGEKLLDRAGTEYRLWDPFRSKLAACIYNGLERLPIIPGSRVLYLGASTGTTASHVSDIVGGRGAVFAVEPAGRVARDLLHRVASRRPNVIPIMQDSRRPGEYPGMYGAADVVYADIAQPDQTAMAVANCKMYLRAEGSLLLVIKARSIDSVRDPAGVIREETAKLEADFGISQAVDLRTYDRDHSLVHAVYPG